VAAIFNAFCGQQSLAKSTKLWQLLQNLSLKVSTQKFGAIVGKI